jgi:hypothetical protein
MSHKAQADGPEREDAQAPGDDSDVEEVESGEKAQTGSMAEEVERAPEREDDAAEG